MNEDDNFNFDENSLSDEERSEVEKQMKEEEEKLAKHPLNIQAHEIMEMIDVLLDTCNDDKAKDMYGATLRESAMIIITKLASGLTSDDYVLSMQKAAIIRDHAEYLRLSNHMLNSLDVFDKTYVKTFRAEMERFRELFREWAAEIHRQDNDYGDEWGLFVKPGT